METEERNQPSNYPKAILECLATWEAFRQLGFSAEEIFLNFYVGDRVIGISVPGASKEPVVVKGGTVSEGLTEKDVYDLWAKAAEGWNGLWSPLEIEKVWQESEVSKKSMAFVTHLVMAGVKLHKPELAAYNRRKNQRSIN